MPAAWGAWSHGSPDASRAWGGGHRGSAMCRQSRAPPPCLPAASLVGLERGGLWRGPGWNSPHCGPGQEPLASLRGAGDICRDKDQAEAEPDLRVCRALVAVGVGVAIESLSLPRTEAAESREMSRTGNATSSAAETESSPVCLDAAPCVLSASPEGAVRQGPGRHGEMALATAEVGSTGGAAPARRSV